MDVDNIPTHFPPYEGNDPNTSVEPHCKSCWDEGQPDKPLLRCTGCKCVYYCSQKCQKKDWPAHKEECRDIKKMEMQVEKEAATLRSTNEHSFRMGPPENLFETQVGSFWGILETRDYMIERFALAERIYHLAYWEETVELWEKVLGHYQELMRLSSSDNLGVRYKFPFVLLYLNRDDDAYSFCRYWINWDDEDHDEREQKHLESKENDWLYPKEEGCRYLDIFEESPNVNPKDMNLSFLVALCIIKLRLVAAYDAKKQGGANNMSDEESAKIESNRRQIQRLMDQIHKNNPSMLPSLINPMPLKSQPLPDFHSPGHATEAYLVLNSANRAWIRVPGAEDLLVQRFGRNPEYNHDLSL